MAMSERDRKRKIILDEIERYKKKQAKAQVYYAYGSRSAEHTMEKYAILEQALEASIDAQETQSELRQKLLDVGEAMKRAEKQIDLYGEKSLSVRQVIWEVKRLVYGNG